MLTLKLLFAYFPPTAGSTDGVHLQGVPCWPQNGDHEEGVAQGYVGPTEEELRGWSSVPTL